MPPRPPRVGPGRHSSPRHRTPFTSRREGSNALDDVASNICRALAAGAVSQMVSPPAMQLICTPLHLMAGPAHAFPDCLFIVYRRTCAHSPRAPPWPGHSFSLQLSLTVCS